MIITGIHSSSSPENPKDLMIKHHGITCNFDHGDMEGRCEGEQPELSVHLLHHYYQFGTTALMTSQPRRQPFLRKTIPRLNSRGGHIAVLDAAPPNTTTYSSIPIERSNDSNTLERHLTLLDLIAIGVGGTIGSGLFVLAGLVAHNYAGPSAVGSWTLAGLTALLSGSCYAELAGRIPIAGGAYAYCFVALGELPAFFAAVCLSLEYVAASAAVARSWGDKCSLYVIENFDSGKNFLSLEGSFSPPACCLSSAIILLLLAGVKESKRVTNVFTGLKVALVFFMILAGAFYIKPENWTPAFPMGTAGMFRGAAGTFFGYLGYDQLCGLAGEAVNPKRNLPLAIMITLCFVATIYTAASLVLTGMQPWQDISPVAGFPAAFGANGAQWAGQITALGEILTLPIVILVTIMVQPRLQYALAKDGLLPAFFSQVDETGNLWNGTLVAGVAMTVIASFVPFEHLNDVISCGILTVLSLTDSSVVLLWHEAPAESAVLARYLMATFHTACLATCFLLMHYGDSNLGKWALLISGTVTLALPFVITQWCPRTLVFGGHRHHYHEEQIIREAGYFRTPLVPFLPCLAIFVNYYLFVQLDWTGPAGLFVCLGTSSIYYFFGATHQTVDEKEELESSACTGENVSLINT